MPSAKRDHLIDTALRLFNRDGYHATGIDRVIEEAGVARMTLYNHFKSKDELILAALARRDERFLAWIDGRLRALAETPRDRLLAMFDALGEWFQSDDFSGCMFINASAEFGQADNPIHKAAADHKILVWRHFRDLAKAAGAADPRDLASSLMLLAEGAIVMAYVAGRKDAAAQARKAAGQLIKQAGLAQAATA